MNGWLLAGGILGLALFVYLVVFLLAGERLL
jgi:hypothetical protein